MRGPWLKTPLLFLLLLFSRLTGTAFCEDASTDTTTPGNATADGEVLKDGDDDESQDEDHALIPYTTSSPPETEIEDPGSGEPDTLPRSVGDNLNLTDPAEEEVDELDISLILIPAVLAVVILGAIVCGIFIMRWRNKKAENQELSKEDPHLDGSSTEKVPMPMFEDDVPSVLELEMDELNQWMKKDS
ncbi:transmembrane protein 154 [Girardinichthys multiradiatus]|uniref:transmembrane protein 154 n=1 Tax=Girardinichthys multiradiatus TaxID=208333 RepID=UPI001FACC362|nr:transmembrane protein 154 [Girardinichthys multiradiatus]